jgi:ABC-type Fe3+-hydroxamate transport system substrate-binding protein
VLNFFGVDTAKVGRNVTLTVPLHLYINVYAIFTLYISSINSFEGILLLHPDIILTTVSSPTRPPSRTSLVDAEVPCVVLGTTFVPVYRLYAYL